MFAFTLVCLKYVCDAVAAAATDLYDLYCNHNRVLVRRAIAFSLDSNVKEEDVTGAVKDYLRDSAFLDVPLDIDRMEIRYSVNGSKYRAITSSRFHMPYTLDLPVVNVSAVDVDNGTDYSGRVRKYVGPHGDFHGMSKVYLSDFFPHTPRNAQPKQLRVTIARNDEVNTYVINRDPLVAEPSTFRIS